jgi:hypothetical protein
VKALIFVGLWLGVGAFVSLRRPAPPAERVLAALFWPLFLLSPTGPAAAPRADEPAPLRRLRAALGPADPAAAVVGELAAALARVDARAARLAAALAELGPDDGGAIGQARARSRELLDRSRQAAERERDEALAAIEEAATRLLVASEDGERADVAGLLRSLRARLDASRELADG